MKQCAATRLHSNKNPGSVLTQFWEQSSWSPCVLLKCCSFPSHDNKSTVSGDVRSVMWMTEWAVASPPQSDWDYVHVWVSTVICLHT